MGQSSPGSLSHPDRQGSHLLSVEQGPVRPSRYGAFYDDLVAGVGEPVDGRGWGPPRPVGMTNAVVDAAPAIGATACPWSGPPWPQPRHVPVPGSDGSISEGLSDEALAHADRSDSRRSRNWREKARSELVFDEVCCWRRIASRVSRSCVSSCTTLRHASAAFS